MVYPHYLAPTPSMGIVQFTPDPEAGRLENGYVLPAGTSLLGRLPRDGTAACEFRSAHAVHLWPVTIERAEYYAAPSQISALRLPERTPARAALRLRLRTTNGLPFNQLALKSLTCFLPPAGGVGGALLGQLLADCTGVVAQPPESPLPWRETLSPRSVRHTGLDEDQALLPYGPRSFSGYRLVQEYFSLPERVLFVEFTGLANAVRRCAGSELDIIVLLRRADPQLERGVTAGSFQLHCTPVVNLFHRRADRVPVSERTYEYHLVVDRVRPLDIEVYTVLDVVGEGDAGTQPVSFQPFYATAETGRTNARQPAYYTIRREKRLPSARRRLYGGRTSYLGSEVFLSVVDRDAVPISPNLRQFAVSCLCSNRDLPLLMPLGGDASDFTLQIGAPVQSVRCLVGPTRPRPSSVHGDVAWKVISHLSLNYLSISDREDRPDDGAQALREMLGLYADQTDASIARQVDGVRSVTSAPVVRRLPGGGQSAIARGLEITITLEEAAFEGIGTVPIGTVLSSFFARHASINSFTETVLRVEGRGEVMRWPMQAGRRAAA
jgi:type VI secretion system protein ImpG